MNLARVHDPFNFGGAAVDVLARRTPTPTPEQAAALLQAREAAALKCWRAFCETVPGYLLPSATKVERLPDPDAYAAVVAWHEQTLLPRSEDGEADPRGIYAFGPSGMGKTRTLLELCRRCILVDQDSVAFWVAGELKDQLFELRAHPEERRELVAELVSCSLLIIDEHGHCLNDGFGEALRTILERRGPRGLVIASQYSPAEFRRQWTGRRGGELARHAEAIARRLSEFCVGIHFQARPTKKPPEANHATRSPA